MAANNHPLRKRAEYGLLKSIVQMLCESSLHVEVEKGSQQAPSTVCFFSNTKQKLQFSAVSTLRVQSYLASSMFIQLILLNFALLYHKTSSNEALP